MMKLTTHETVSLHEILMAKTLWAAKLVTMKPFTTDPELKNLLQQDILTTKTQLTELQDFLEQGAKP